MDKWVGCRKKWIATKCINALLNAPNGIGTDPSMNQSRIMHSLQASGNLLNHGR
jgi:hypothetical protein